MPASFIWWHVNGDGTATAFDDTPEVRARIDAFEPGWFGSIEGAIRHGGVIATAFHRQTEQTYDAVHWLNTGEMLPAGTITTTIITAQRNS